MVPDEPESVESYGVAPVRSTRSNLPLLLMALIIRSIRVPSNLRSGAWAGSGFDPNMVVSI